MNRSLLVPQEGDSSEKLIDRAWRCGFHLDPADHLSDWMDDHPDRDNLIAAYHAGQSERYEREDW